VLHPVPITGLLEHCKSSPFRLRNCFTLGRLKNCKRDHSIHYPARSSVIPETLQLNAALSQGHHCFRVPHLLSSWCGSNPVTVVSLRPQNATFISYTKQSNRMCDVNM